VGVDEEDDDMEPTTTNLRAVARSSSPAVQSRRPWLVIVSGPHGIGEMFPLEQQMVLGRSPQCDVRIDEDGVSRRHATLQPTGDGSIEILDLESRNGTRVNGEPVTRRTLQDGDKIQIGSTTVLKLDYQDSYDEALQRNLYESAMRDPLTRALNKRGFGESLVRECAFAVRHARPLSLLALDVDHFKRVNDTYGHPVGDYVLRRLVELIESVIRREDVLGRVGGEEFAILLRDIAPRGALDCAERIRAHVERSTFEAPGAVIPITISIGVATLEPATSLSPVGLFEAADRALYAAKHTGRNRVCVAGAAGEAGDAR
jgi:diguanylate cyclase (GGDEF)-like protein